MKIENTRGQTGRKNTSDKPNKPSMKLNITKNKAKQMAYLSTNIVGLLHYEPGAPV